MSEINLSPLLISKNIRPNCNYSIYIETPKIKLLCYLNGPYYSTNMNITESKMLINLKIKSPSYINNPFLERDIQNKESKLKNILQKHLLIAKYPRSKLDIVIEIYEINCDYFPYALIATSICCNYANIEQRGILSSCTLLLNDKNEIIIEPEFDKIYNDKYTKFNMAYNIPLQETISFFQDGYCDDEILKKIIATSMKICDTYNKFILNKIENENE